MVDPPWMPRTEEEYRQQLAEDEAEQIGEALERQRQPENQPSLDEDNPYPLADRLDQGWLSSDDLEVE